MRPAGPPPLDPWHPPLGLHALYRHLRTLPRRGFLAGVRPRPAPPHRPPGKELNLWDDQAHVWGEDSCYTVDGTFWTLELVIGRRRYRASGCTYGARFGLCQRLLGLKPTPSWDY
jgi:hypothetical protein